MVGTPAECPMLHSLTGYSDLICTQIHMMYHAWALVIKVGENLSYLPCRTVQYLPSFMLSLMFYILIYGVHESQCMHGA